MTVMEDRAAMSAASINDLPDSAFAHIEPGGKKDSGGRTVPRSLRHYPVHDAAHARDALGRAQAQINGGDADAKRIAQAAMPKIRAAARKFGIEVSDDSHAGHTSLELLKRRRCSMIRQRERRGLLFASSGEPEMRAKPDGTGGTKYEFRGYASTFGDWFTVWDKWNDEYEESVRPGGFSETLSGAFGGPDVRFYIGHNESGLALARTAHGRWDGTMRLLQDSRGLEVNAPDLDGRNSEVRNMHSAVERGDVDGMSIGFVTRGQEWSDDYMRRTLTSLDLHNGDVSVVSVPANPNAVGATMIPLSSGGGMSLSRQAAQQRAASHGPFTGTHSHAHPAYGDGGQHDHEHEHQGDADHDHHRTTDDPDSDGLTPTLDQASARRPAEQLARGEVADNDSRPDFNVPENDPASNGQSMVKCPYTRKNGCGQMNPGGSRFCNNCGGPLYNGDGTLVLDDSGVVEEVNGAMGDANLLSSVMPLELMKMRTRMRQLAH